MSLSNLHLRDLRQLFSSQVKSEPAISVRRNCILVNFETLRGIVLVDRCCHISCLCPHVDAK